MASSMDRLVEVNAKATAANPWHLFFPFGSACTYMGMNDVYVPNRRQTRFLPGKRDLHKSVVHALARIDFIPGVIGLQISLSARVPDHHRAAPYSPSAMTSYVLPSLTHLFWGMASWVGGNNRSAGQRSPIRQDTVKKSGELKDHGTIVLWLK
jgi:hypothetical protein